MGLAERENKRKNSVVGAMLSESSEGADAEIVRHGEINITPKAKAETRSKRVNLLIPPSLYIEVQEKCKDMGISLNECINQFLTAWVQPK